MLTVDIPGDQRLGRGSLRIHLDDRGGHGDNGRAIVRPSEGPKLWVEIHTSNCPHIHLSHLICIRIATSWDTAHLMELWEQQR
jgi:hypothetical protein